MKIVSPDILHKSDAGGVRLGLLTADAAKNAAHDMAAIIRARFPKARIRGFAVESMITVEHGHELIVGLKLDAAFGTILAVGAGGKAVEVLDDKAVELAPVDAALATAMIGRTRISRLLAGYRDEPAADLEAIAAALTGVSDLAADLPQIVELDINPLLAAPGGVWVVDARVRVG